MSACSRVECLLFLHSPTSNFKPDNACNINCIVLGSIGYKFPLFFLLFYFFNSKIHGFRRPGNCRFSNADPYLLEPGQNLCASQKKNKFEPGNSFDTVCIMFELSFASFPVFFIIIICFHFKTAFSHFSMFPFFFFHRYTCPGRCYSHTARKKEQL